MSFGFFAIFVFASMVSSNDGWAATDTVVTSAAGQVGGEVITSRQVQISYIVDQFLLTRANKKLSADKTNWMLKENSDLFRTHLSQVMLEQLVKMEAESFSVAQVSPEDLKIDVSQIKSGLKDWSEWKNLEVSDTELEQTINRRRMAKNFLKFKTESSGVVIPDAEAKAYYDKNRVKFGSAPFNDFKESIREVLAQQQLEEKLKDWFEILKRKYRVRFLHAAPTT